MPDIREQASETLKLLTDATAGAELAEELRDETLGALARIQRSTDQLSANRRAQGSSRGGSVFSAAELKAIRADQERQEEELARLEASPDRIRARADALGLSPEQELLARQSGDLGATLNAELDDELMRLGQRLGEAGDKPRENPEYLQLLADRDMLRSNEFKFRQRYGLHIAQDPDSGQDALPWDTGYTEADGATPSKFTTDYVNELRGGSSTLRQVAGSAAGGLIGATGVVASALGAEDTGQALGALGTTVREGISQNNLADRAATLESGDIIRRAQLPAEDPEHLPMQTAALDLIKLTLTDVDAAQNLVSGLGGAVVGGKGLQLAGRGAGAVAGAVPGVGAVGRAAAPLANAVAPQGVRTATAASLAGTGQSVDGTLTTEEARLRAGSSILSGQVGRILTPAENLIGNTASRIVGRGTPSTARGGVTGTVGGAVNTGAAEVIQGGIENAGEVFAEAATAQGLSVTEALQNPEVQRSALIQAGVTAPLEGVAGGFVGATTGGVGGARNARRAKAELKADEAAEAAAEKEGDERVLSEAEQEQAVAERNVFVRALRVDLNRDRGAKAADPENLNVADNDGVATIDNTFFTDVDAEENFNQFRDQPPEIQELTVRALYQQTQGLDPIAEDAFINSVFGIDGDKPFTKKDAFADFQERFQTAAQDSNNTVQLDALREQAEQDRAAREQRQAAQQIIQDQADIVNQRETDTFGEQVTEDDATPDTPIEAIGQRQQTQATLTTEFFRDREGRTNLIDFINLPDDDTRAARLRALYRQTVTVDQNQQAEDAFIQSAMGNYNDIVNDPDQTLTQAVFQDVLNAAADVATGLSGVFTPQSPVTPVDPNAPPPPLTPSEIAATAQGLQGSTPTPQQIDENQQSLADQRRLEDTRTPSGVVPGLITRRQQELRGAGRDNSTLTGFFYGENAQENIDAFIQETPEDQAVTLRALIRSDSSLDNIAEDTLVARFGAASSDASLEQVRTQLQNAFSDRQNTRAVAAAAQGANARQAEADQQTTNPFDSIRQGLLPGAREGNPNLIPTSDVDAPTGTAPVDTTTNPAEVEAEASRPATVTNTLIPNTDLVTTTDAVKGYVRNVQQSAFRALNEMDPETRLTALEQLAQRDGLSPLEARQFAETLNRSGLGDTLSDFTNNVTNAFVGAGGSTRPPPSDPGGNSSSSTEADDAFRALNDRVSKDAGYTTSNSSAETYYDYTDGEGFSFNSAARRFFDLAESDPVKNVVYDRALTNIRNALQRTSPMPAGTARVFLNNLHALERGRINAGK